MSHTALARKYRPRSFAAVATQGHVSETLRRAVSSGRVGHAYLFCGPRGVGKTSVARVLAMALNCAHRTEEGEPCGQCESCERIWSGHTSLDVVEIDAASNRGVDDARELRERAMYAPSEEGRHKVYIVDEAHMLTREAWNALLKVIEEPPARVIFIFATTEPQKIEQTAAPILSRCQRFDFRRIGVADIAARLRDVLGQEEVEAADDALRVIARKADGGMRDALSITDQVLSMAGGEVTGEAVARVLGMVAEDRYLELFDLLAERDRSGLFRFVSELLDEGYDLVEFYHGLMEAMRTLLRIRLEGGTLPEVSEDVRPEWDARAERFDTGDLVRMLALGSELETTGSLRRSAQPRVLLELLLLRMSYLERTVDLETLLRSLGPATEGPTGSGDGPTGTSDPPVTPGAATTPEAGAGRTGTGSRSSAAPIPGSEAVAPPDQRPEAQRGEGGNGHDAARAADGSRATHEAPRTPAATGAPADGTPAPGAREAWARLLQDRDVLPEGLRPFLRAADLEASGDRIVLRLPAGPGLERLGEPAVRRQLEDGLQRYLDRTIRLEVEEVEVAAGGRQGRIDEGTVRRDELKELLDREPGLRPAVQELDLEIRD